jgi:hypothetical protein
MEHSPNTIKEGVLKAISEHKVAMRSATFFKVEYALILIVSLLILLVTIGLAGFILFALRVNGHEALLSYGPRGIQAFLLVFPWPLFVLDLLLLIVLQALMRRFAFGYRRPIFVILAVLFVGGGVSALLLDRETSVHDRLMEESHHGGIPPPFSTLYGNARGPAPHAQGIYRGVVTEIRADRIVIQHDDLDADQDDRGFEVILPDGQIPSTFVVGEDVYVYGAERHGVITAVGISELSPMK